MEELTKINDFIKTESSVKEIASLLGITENAVYQKLSNRRKFTIKEALIIAERFGVTVEELFKED